MFIAALIKSGVVCGLLTVNALKINQSPHIVSFRTGRLYGFGPDFNQLPLVPEIQVIMLICSDSIHNHLEAEEGRLGSAIRHYSCPGNTLLCLDESQTAKTIQTF
ncbi:uncharacterized [Tachysurus ichikawai]